MGLAIFFFRRMGKAFICEGDLDIENNYQSMTIFLFMVLSLTE